MSGLCGWFAAGPLADADAVLARMEAALPGRAGQRLVQPGPGCGLAVRHSTVRPVLFDGDDVCLAWVGHPMLRQGGTSSAEPAELARWLAAQGPRTGLATIGGDFAMAFWDKRARQGWIAVDRIGVHQLVYARIGADLVFASTLDGLAPYPGVSRELEPQALFDYLYYHVTPGPGTVFRGQFRVPPGQLVEFGPQGVREPQPYWSLRFDEQPGRPLEPLKGEFRDLVRQAVAEGADAAAVGSFLSGGTDSSTVSGMLSKLGRGPAQTFSIGFDVQGYDEMSYARIAARHFGCQHFEYYVTPADVVDSVPRIAAAYDQPFGNASAIPTYYCARLAREHGIERLLAGDGGDELFGGNERYAKHYLLGLYDRVPAGLRRAMLEPLLLASTPLHEVQPLRKLKSYVEQASQPMPRRYESYNLLNRLGVREIFEADFLAAVDIGHPGQLVAQAHAPFARDSLINQMLGIDFRFVLADGDLPKVTRMCELAGVDVAFPFLDDRLLQFSTTLPADLKLRRTHLRWFFKQALADFLPREVITKQKHGFGLPVGAWLVSHEPLRALAVDSIAALRTRRLVKQSFVDDLLKNKLAEHPAYYGAMVWILMMLGQWLESRRL